MKSYYFSHDYNASSDVKILFLRQQLGMEGYGIYWYIIEALASAGGKLPIKILPVLALQMQTSEVKVLAVIKEFDLFKIESEHFFSIRLHRTLHNIKKIKEINSEKGKKSAAKRLANSNHGSTAVQPELNHGSTAVQQIKENKRKEDIVLLGSTPEKNSVLCYNIEEYLCKNETTFESICMKAKKTKVMGMEELMKCHLHLEKKAMYPMAVKAAVAWFTSWLLNSDDYNAKYGAPKKAGQPAEPPKKNIDELLKKYQ
jgi:uncharacterized protein YdaU (DUF1376 family)